MSSFHSQVRPQAIPSPLSVLWASEPQGSNALLVRKRRSTANEVCGSLKKRRHSCLGLGGPQVRKEHVRANGPVLRKPGETNDD